MFGPGPIPPRRFVPSRRLVPLHHDSMCSRCAASDGQMAGSAGMFRRATPHASERARASDAMSARDAATALVIFTAGDVAAQQIEHGSEAIAPLSGERIAGASALGLIWGGGISPTVYRLNEHLFPGKQPRTIAKKILFSFGLLGCVGNWGLIFSKRMLSANSSASAPMKPAALPLDERAKATARSVNVDFPEVLSNDIKVWPLTDLIVFSLVPIRWRVAFVSSVSVCWQTYLSYTASQGTAASSPPPPPLPTEAASSPAPRGALVRRASSRPYRTV